MTDMNQRPTDAHLEAVAEASVFAMCRLIERLMNEGYVYPQRIPELSERIQNMERGDGFLTSAELRKRGTPTTDEAMTAEDFLA